jgi:type I restriction enzyme M protein
LGNYRQDADGQPYEVPERFRYGQVPLRGQEGRPDVPAAHARGHLREGGMAATVMPHGVLFRGGDERDIRGHDR